MEILAKIKQHGMSFAHLSGILGKKAEKDEDEGRDESERDHEDQSARKAWQKKAETDDDRKQCEDEEDDEYATRMKRMDREESDEEEGEEEEDDDKKGKKAKKAKAEEDDEEACPKGKKGERAEDPGKEDDDVEMRGSSPIAKARLREQKRCAAIFGSHAAAKNPVLAANLAFKTRMPRKEALAVLEGTPVLTVTNIRARLNPDVGPGAAAGMTTKQAVTAAWDTAFAKATGKTRK